MKRRGKGARNNAEWVTFPRCFLLTMGLIFICIPAYVLENPGDREAFPGWAVALLMGMLIIGILLLAVVFIGSRRDAESWMNAGSNHEASLIIMVIAAPLYFILKLLAGKRGK